MFGIESLFTQLFGENSLIIMLAGFFALVLLNLLTKLALEIKRKNLNWDDLPEFMNPLILFSVFLVGLEFLVLAGRGLPAVYELFQGLQILGYVAVMGKYFKKFYTNLKELGMPTDPELDASFEEKLNSISHETREDINYIVEEYLRKKQEGKGNA